MTEAQAAEYHGNEWGLTDTCTEGYIHQFQPEATQKFTRSKRSTEFKQTTLKWSQRPSKSAWE